MALPRQNTYFIPHDDIDRDVIMTDIHFYLGEDAKVTPGTYKNTLNGQRIQGYYISSHAPLATAMIDDLKECSRQWRSERSMNPNGGVRESPSGVDPETSAHPEAYHLSQTYYARYHSQGPNVNFAWNTPSLQQYPDSLASQTSYDIASAYPTELFIQPDQEIPLYLPQTPQQPFNPPSNQPHQPPSGNS